MKIKNKGFNITGSVLREKNLGTLKLKVSQFLYKWQFTKYPGNIFALYLYKITQMVIEVLVFCENEYTTPLPPNPISYTFISI